MDSHGVTEEILYESGVVKITPARVVSGGATYAVANISSVKAENDSGVRYGGIAVVVLGSLVALSAIYVGLAAVAIGIVLIIFGKRTNIIITTNATEQHAFSSRDEKAALAVASAINLAIMKRSANMGIAR